MHIKVKVEINIIKPKDAKCRWKISETDLGLGRSVAAEITGKRLRWNRATVFRSPFCTLRLCRAEIGRLNQPSLAREQPVRNLTCSNGDRDLNLSLFRGFLSQTDLKWPNWTDSVELFLNPLLTSSFPLVVKLHRQCSIGCNISLPGRWDAWWWRL